MATIIDLSGCACCGTVPCQSNDAPIKKILHASVTICGVTTPVPDVVMQLISGTYQWIWAAPTLAERVLIGGCADADADAGIDVINTVELPCGTGLGAWGAAGLAIRNSTGALRTLFSTSYTVLDPGPGTFHIRYNFGDLFGEGVTCCGGGADSFVDFFE